MQVNYLVEILRLDNNGIDYVGANYIGDMLTINVYITTLVRVNFPPLHYDIYIAIIVVLELLSLRRKWLVVHQITMYTRGRVGVKFLPFLYILVRCETCTSLRSVNLPSTAF